MLSVTDKFVALIVVVVPLTVKSPVITKLPPTSIPSVVVRLYRVAVLLGVMKAETS